jgi:hypothetical protein
VPSVMGLLEERERAARQRVEVLQAELGEAEAALERFVIARETVGQVLAEPSGGEDAVVSVREERALGLEPVPAKVEGVRSKAERLAARGWLVEAVPGRFSGAAGPGGGS